MKSYSKSAIRLSGFASIILYIVSLFFLVVVPILDYFTDSAFPSADLRYMLGFGTAIGGISLQLLSHKEDIEERIRKSENSPSVRFVGASDVALSEISNKIASARHVYNTFVGIRNSPADITSKLYERWISSTKAVEWIDIVGPAQVFDRRYILSKPKSVIGQHSIIVIRHGTPIVNFIIMDYTDNASNSTYMPSSEVYFGWISSERSSQRIFQSTDRFVINTFRRHFVALKEHRTWGKPIAVNYHAKDPADRILRGDLVNKIGHWLTLSVDDQSRVCTFGFFIIDISQAHTEATKAGVLNISGVVLDLSLTIIEEMRHGEEHISHYTNKMFIEYSNTSNSSRRGVCFYEFSHSKIGTRPTDDLIDGFYLDDNSWTARKIFGVKSREAFDPFNAAGHASLAHTLLDDLVRHKKISEEIADSARRKLNSLQ